MKKLLTSVLATLTLGAFAQNTAMNFDGVDDYIQTSYSGISGDGARTLEAWVRTTEDAVGNQQVILDWGNTGTGERFTFNILQNNSLRLEVAGNGVVGTTAVNDGAWHHLAATYNPADDDTVRLYIDGVQDAKKKIDIVNTGSTNSVMIGRRQDDVNYFTGDIDEVRIWNTAKTQAEIVSNMNAELCATASDLVAYYTFNEGTADVDNTALTSSMDLSQTQASSTLMNFDLTGTSSNYVAGPALISGLSFSSVSTTNCGDYTWAENATTYSTSGMYSTVLAGANDAGCDSVVYLNLTVLSNDTTFEDVAECMTYTWSVNSQTYTASTVETVTLTDINGCDSVVVLNLTIDQPSATTDVIVACDTYTWVDGNTYTASNNTATHVFITAGGCDSTVTLDLTINESYSTTQTLTNCGPYTWAENSTEYTTSGLYSETYTRINGCDSIINLDLTVVINDTTVNEIEECITYTWPANNQTYTATTQDTVDLTDIFGCDSVVVLDLTIHQPNTGVDVQVHCDTYTWIDGNTYTASNNTATHTLSNINGCDSVVTLNLTINNSDNIVENVVNCGAYTWSETNTQYVLSGTYTAAYTNQFGCDSIHTLNLTINPNYFKTVNVNACDSYTWSANGTTYTTSGTHIETLQSVAGCDSIVTLNLTVNNNVTATETVESCGDYTWPADGMVYTATGQYTTVLTSSTGCDSTITLDLTVINLNNGITDLGNGTFTSDDTDANTTYQWLDCNGGLSIIAGETSKDFTPSVLGNYAVEVTNSTCADTSNCLIIVDVSVDESTATNFNIYPNPTNGVFNISFNNAISGTLVITDLGGRTIYSQELVSSEFESIELSETPTGVYLVNIISEKGNTTEKLIIK